MKHVWTFQPETKALLPGNPRALQVPHYNAHLPEDDPKKYARLPNSTETAPPEPQEGFCPAWDEEQHSWSMIEDHRLDETIYYLTKDRVDDNGVVIAEAGEEITFTELGPLPGDLTAEEPAEFDVWDAGIGAWAEDTEAKLAAPLIAIKARANKIILERIPSWKQANMTARGVELVNIKVSGVALSPEEQGEELTMGEAWGWVKAVRTRSDDLEAAIAAGTDVDIEAGAIAGAGSWPAS